MSELMNELERQMYLLDSGQDLEITRKEDGKVHIDIFEPVPMPMTEGGQMMAGAAGRPDPFQMAETYGDELTLSEVAGAAGGLVSGFASAPVTTGPDIVGLLRGAGMAIGAEDGQRLESFIKGFESISGVVGSMKAQELLGQAMNTLEVPEDVQNAIKTGFVMGEVIGPAGPGVSTFKELSKVLTAPGKAPIQAPRQPGAIMRDVETEAVKQPIIYEQLPQRTTIDPEDQANWQQLQSDLKIAQPIITADDAMDAARRNQTMLATNGESIASDLGAKFKNPGIKGSNDQGRRMAEKAKSKGGIQQLTDVTRGGFAVQTSEQADQVVERLAQEFKVIDEGFNVTELGYFDRKVLIVNPDGQIGEVQVWAEPLFKAKLEDGGQDLYGIYRGKDPKEMTAAERKEYRATVKKYGLQGDTHEEVSASARQKSIDLYAGAINELDESMKGIAIDALRRMVAEGGDKAETANIMLERIGGATQ